MRVGEGLEAVIEAGGKANASRCRLRRRRESPNSVPIAAFKPCERVGHEGIEFGLAGGIQPVRCQDLVVKPLKQGLPVFGEANRERLLSPRLGPCGREPVTLFSLPSGGPCTFEGGSFGDARLSAVFQWVGYPGTVSKGGKDSALTRNRRPGERLAGPQPPSAIGQRIVRGHALSR